MSLRTYNKKRSFEKTAEPKGLRTGRSKQGLRFVIQQHDATHLHYDFRLEMDGVLKSWAVPKGPSMDPDVKRLAMMVEDHPYSYKDFEGIIPEGNYGAGTVIVWDEGIYEPLEEPGRRLTGEKLLLRMLREGSLKFRLQGKKLKGEFALVQTRSMGKNAWLLIKHKDRYATDKDITQKNKSVHSGKTLERIRANASVKKAPPKKKVVVKKTVAKKTGKKPVTKAPNEPAPEAKQKAYTKSLSSLQTKALLKQARKTAFPKKISPMLATLVAEPFDREGWEYEVKWDGYRALAFLNGKEAALRSRNDKSFDDKFYPIYEALKNWNINAVVDGEIVAVNDEGIAGFSDLQHWRSEADGTLLYYVFDLLWLDGYDTTGLPLSDRKLLLKSLISSDNVIRMGLTVQDKGISFFHTARKMGLEGIMAKKSDSLYWAGERTREWLKIKARQQQEVVIVGYTLNKDSPKSFSSLLLGVYEQGKLRYAGKVGTGFNNTMQQEMMQAFTPLIVKKNPFAALPDYNKASRFRPGPPHVSITWLRPSLVAEIGFTEVTADGLFRHPSFIALRDDKKAKEVVLEKPVHKISKQRKQAHAATKMVKAPTKGKSRKTLLNPSEETQVRTIGGNELKFTHLSKWYWPDDRISKRDMLNYYYQVAPYILPYLEDRPLSLNRFPGGIKGKSFYQKDVSKTIPDWARTFPYRTADEDRDKEYLVGGSETGLLYMANLGTIEMNPWNSRISQPDYPDWCVLDLDPAKNNTFDQVIETALAVKEALDQLKIKGYCKTSGSTGMHIYIPLGAQYHYDQSQLLGKFIATQVQLKLPAFTTIERMIRKRRGKLYIDYLQNRAQATLAAPYSLRPKPGATVSMPLHWEEVKKGLQMKDFTIKNAMSRIRETGDLFRPVLGKGIDLEQLSLASPS